MRNYPILGRPILLLIAHQKVSGNDPHNKLL